MKTLREQIAGWCRYYRGRHGHDACEAGVAYDSFRDAAGQRASFANLPCFAGDGRLPCEHRSFPTPEEVEAQVAESDRAIQKISKARAAIVASRKQAGVIDCPVCGKAQSLRFAVSSYNGHVHAGCPGCVSWME